MKFATVFCVALSLLSGLVAAMPNPDNAEDAGVEVRAASELVASHILTWHPITRISTSAAVAVMEVVVVMDVTEVMVAIAVIAVGVIAAAATADVTERFHQYSTSIITLPDGIDVVTLCFCEKCEQPPMLFKAIMH